MKLDEKKKAAEEWFRKLRDDICKEFERLEAEMFTEHPQVKVPHGYFERTPWTRPEGGGGEMSIMKGRVFEKVGVNISTVHGTFSEQFRKEIPGADADPRFWASGISLVAHMQSPLVPAVHMNTRMVIVGGSADGEERRVWFGGGADLNPTATTFDEDVADFHTTFRHACKGTDAAYYEKFKQWCDEYFWIKHRAEPRGAGGIFYDYLDTDWERHFAFTQAVGRAFQIVYPKIVRRRMHDSWTDKEREKQLVKRGRYAEFNLLYDRGTKFGLMTGGNVEAILMSLPPLAVWE